MRYDFDTDLDETRVTNFPEFNVSEIEYSFIDHKTKQTENRKRVIILLSKQKLDLIALINPFKHILLTG